MYFSLGLLSVLNVLCIDAIDMFNPCMEKRPLTFEERLKKQIKMRNDFTSKMKEIVYDLYQHKFCTNTERALGFIFDQIGDDFDRLLLLVADAVVNTKGFTKYSRGSDKISKWIPRGILMISGKDNYEILKEITGDEDWINKPEYLGSPSRKSVAASLAFFDYKLEDKHLDFFTVLRALHPDQIPQAKGCISKPSEIFRQKLHVYQEITKSFGRNPLLQEPRKHHH